MVEVPDLMPAHVSVENEFPEDLFNAMAAFIQKHPVCISTVLLTEFV